MRRAVGEIFKARGARLAELIGGVLETEWCDAQLWRLKRISRNAWLHHVAPIEHPIPTAAPIDVSLPHCTRAIARTVVGRLMLGVYPVERACDRVCWRLPKIKLLIEQCCMRCAFHIW